MSKVITTATNSTVSRAKKAGASVMASRIRPAATKPVKTTLPDIRRAVHKSLKEHPATPDA